MLSSICIYHITGGVLIPGDQHMCHSIHHTRRWNWCLREFAHVSLGDAVIFYGTTENLNLCKGSGAIMWSCIDGA